MELPKTIKEMITLSTPQGRILTWATLTAIIFVIPYHWLSNLSLWQRLGWDWAPSIGLTRAYWRLIHGDVAGAWERNRLIFLIVIVGGTLLALDLFRIFKSRQTASKDLH